MRFFILLEGDILARMTDEAYMRRALELALQETQERSGVFEGRFIPMLLNTNAPAPAKAPTSLK